MPIKEDTPQDQGGGRKHPIPQNVMDVEFKVVGDLSLRQVMYIAFGMVGAYIVFKSGIPNFWKYILMFLIGGLGTAVAFIPIQERGLDKWLVIFINSILAPTQRVWKKIDGSSTVSFLSHYDQLEIIKNEMISLTPIKSRNKLEKYLGMIETQDSSALDEAEIQRIEEIQQKFPSLSTSTFTSLQDIEIDAPEFQTPDLGIPVIERDMIRESKIETPNNLTESSERKTSGFEKPPSLTPTKTEIQEDEIASKQELLNALANIEGGYNKEGPIEIFTEQKVNRPILNLPASTSTDFSIRGEIKLKDRKRIPPIIVAEDIKDIKEQEASLEKKVSELLVLAKKARSQYQIKGGKQPMLNTPIVTNVEDRITELTEEKKKLKREIDKSTEQVNMIDNNNKNRIPLQKQIEMLTLKNEELESILKKINNELEELKGTGEYHSVEILQKSATLESSKQEEESIAEKPIKPTPIKNQVDEFAIKPRPIAKSSNSYTPHNIIEGIIKDISGKLVEGAAVIIKDVQGNVIRALKTNQIGQFRTQTSVPNGKYTIEILKGGMKFDIIVVEATGRVLNPIYLVGKGKE